MVTAQKDEFTAALHGNLGNPAQECDFELADLTPVTVYNETAKEDGLQGTPDEIEDIPLPTPEIGDHYVGVKIQLPRGTSNAQGRVKHRARDTDGNVAGRANVEPALDTRACVVEFENGEEAELSANAIA